MNVIRPIRIAACTLALGCGASGPPSRDGSSAVASAPALGPPTVWPGYACAPVPSTSLTPVPQSGVFGSAEFQLSRDGRIAAARPTAHEIQIWNVASGVKVAVIASPTPIHAFALRPDGRALATTSEAGLSLRDLERGSFATVPVGPGDFGAITWTADSRLLVVGRPNQTDLVDASGAVRPSLPTVAAAGAVSPDGRWLFGRNATMWDLAAGQPRWHAAVVPSSVVFSDDGRSVAFAVGDKGISVLDASTGVKRWELATSGRRGSFALSPDGMSVAAYDHGNRPNLRNSDDRGLVLWHGGKRVRLWNSSESKDVRPTFSPDSTRLAFVAAHISEARLYDFEIEVAMAADGSLVSLPYAKSLPLALTGELRQLPPSWSADGNLILQAGNGGLYVFNATTGARRIIGKGLAETSISGDRDVAFSPDDSAIALVAEEGDRQSFRSVVSVWDLRTGTLRASIDDGAGAQSMRPQRYASADYSPDGQLIALSRGDGVLLWDGRSEQLARILDGDLREGNSRSIGFSPDGRVLATSASPGKEVRLWDPHTGARLRTLTFDDATVESLAFSVDGARLAVATNFQESGRGGAQVLIFDPATGSLIRTLRAAPHKGSAGVTNAIHWGPKGRAIVSVDSGGHVDLWNATSDDPPLTLLDKVAEGPSVLSSDGNLLMMGRTTLNVWDLRTRALLREVAGDGSQIERLRLNRRGTVVATVRGDHVDLYRLADGAHATLRRTHSSKASGEGLLTYVDNGAFSGDTEAFGLLQVRVGANLLDVRPLRPDEVNTLYRPNLGLDFMAGCPLGSAR